jgi:hypothetical protein
MTSAALYSPLLLLVAAGIFGAWLPIVRELGRPTRFACAMLCGTAVLTAAGLLVPHAAIPAGSLPLLAIPLVAASVVVARLLSKLSESPGPENAYPGFAATMIVCGSALYAALMLRAEAGVDASAIALVKGLPLAIPFATPALIELLWPLLALPLVASLLAIHLPLRRGWTIAAIWYAAIAVSLVAWHPGSGTAPVAFQTVAALAVFGCAREPRLVPLASVLLFGASISGGTALVAVAAIVAGGYVRDRLTGVSSASRRSRLLLAGPAAAVALLAAARIAETAASHLPSVAGSIAGQLVTGTVGLAWAIALSAVAVLLPADRRGGAALLPLLTPAVAVALMFALDGLRGSGLAGGEAAPHVARFAASALILAAGLAWRRPASRDARPAPREAHAR